MEQEQEQELILTPHGRVWMFDDNITRTSFEPHTIITREDAIAHLEAGGLCNQKRGLKRSTLLVYLSNIKQLSREARLLFSGSETLKISIAAALLINSPMGKVIGNFFLGLNKSEYPIKLFLNEEDAIKWLRTFKEEKL
ncbi:MAG: hypothetical protein KAQ92_04650 [Candidatus Aenigmarchaeota archaeon]|nr:hypothetical protein [Candidatus Aenigmarchaeota archaeon]